MIWLGLVLVLLGGAVFLRYRARRMALRAFHRSHARLDRFKLTKKPFIRATLLADEAIARAVKDHAAENSVDEAATWKRVEDYIDEIIPFFNILTYYKIGLVVSRTLLNFFYKISAEHATGPSADITRRLQLRSPPRYTQGGPLQVGRAKTVFVTKGKIGEGQRWILPPILSFSRILRLSNRRQGRTLA